MILLFEWNSSKSVFVNIPVSLSSTSAIELLCMVFARSISALDILEVRIDDALLLWNMLRGERGLKNIASPASCVLSI